MLITTLEPKRSYSQADIRLWDTDMPAKPLESALVPWAEIGDVISDWKDKWEQTHGPLFSLTHDGFHKH